MFEAEFYKQLFTTLNQGFWLSCKIIVPSALCGLAIGILVGAVRGTNYPRFLVGPLNAYVSLFRGTALLVQIFVCYYGLPSIGNWLNPICAAYGLPLFGNIFKPTAYQASVLIFSLCSGAYHAEYIRGAILSIKRGQFAAARALGFTKAQTFWTIVIPQAVRRAWHGCSNEVVYLIKYSSLAFVVAMKELTNVAMSISNTYFRFTETFFIAGLYYLALVTVATWIFHRVEKAWAIPGFGKG